MFTRNFEKNLFLGGINQTVVVLGAHKSLSYWWNFGSFLGIIFFFQIGRGLLLACSYLPEVRIAFLSVDILSRERNGWILRVFHLNGASFIFLLLYLHIFKGIKIASYRLPLTWRRGTILFFLTIVIAFFFFFLPWGQMSYWGATVITNFVSALPFIGQTTVLWLWGGFRVCQATLSLFFTLHFFLPLLIIGVVGSHLLLLHERGSSSPLGLHRRERKTDFHPLFRRKDRKNISVFICLAILVVLFPFILGDPENFSLANPGASPLHIQPEWYFLYAYAILRAVPNKLGGVIALAGSVGILFFLPLKKRRGATKPHLLICSSLIVTFIILTWVGGQPVESPFIELGAVRSLSYFLLFGWLSIF